MQVSYLVDILYYLLMHAYTPQLTYVSWGNQTSETIRSLR